MSSRLRHRLEAIGYDFWSNSIKLLAAICLAAGAAAVEMALTEGSDAVLDAVSGGDHLHELKDIAVRDVLVGAGLALVIGAILYPRR